MLMHVLDVISSDKDVDSAYGAAWWVYRKGINVEIEDHLFLKSLGYNSIAINS